MNNIKIDAQELGVEAPRASEASRIHGNELTYFDPKIDLNPNIKEINGPINVIRLEGEIDKIKKVIYLFLDSHIDVADQTECQNVFSLDLHQYLANTFYALNKSPKKYDFFFEIYATYISTMPTTASGNEFMLKKQKYVWEVFKFFKKIFKYDDKNNKVKVSNLFRNVRFHYLDLRDYFEKYIIKNIHLLNDVVDDIEKENDKGIRSELLLEMIDLFKKLKKDLRALIKILENPKQVKNNITIKTLEDDEVDVSTMTHLAYKFRHRFKHTSVKNILNKKFDELLEGFDAYNKFIDETIQELIEYNKTVESVGNTLTKDERLSFHYDYGISTFDQREILKRIMDIMDLAESKFTNLFVKLTDIYFLRRFLDKDYVTNAIVYTGAAHSANYVQTLVNYFDFKITHIAYSDLNLKSLNKEIIGKSMEDVLGIIMKPFQQQCSDISAFPKNFS